MKRVLFIGSHGTGVRCLEWMVERQRSVGDFEIVGVVATPNDDESHGWPSVSRAAREHGLPLWMPARINSREFVDEMLGLDADIGFCVFHPQIFKRVLHVAREGIINLHFAPLPRYRGCLPIVHSIKDGNTVHGVTMHFIDEGIDSGPIVGQVTVPIGPTDTGLDLYRRCEDAGVALFREVFEKAIQGRLEPRDQDGSRAIYHFRNELDERRVDMAWDPDALFNYVRAFDFPPYPRPYIDCGRGRRIYLTTIPNEMEAKR